MQVNKNYNSKKQHYDKIKTLPIFVPLLSLLINHRLLWCTWSEWSCTIHPDTDHSKATNTRSWCIKGADESTQARSHRALMHHDPSGLGSLTLIPILRKKTLLFLIFLLCSDRKLFCLCYLSWKVKIFFLCSTDFLKITNEKDKQFGVYCGIYYDPWTTMVVDGAHVLLTFHSEGAHDHTVPPFPQVMDGLEKRRFAIFYNPVEIGKLYDNLATEVYFLVRK